MRERTVMISSSGKTFSLTGWKIGFACAPPEITAAIPVGVFREDPAPFRHWVRFAFCKRDETLREGIERLRRLAG